MSTLKQPLTFEEQVEHLENAHGLVIQIARGLRFGAGRRVVLGFWNPYIAKEKKSGHAVALLDVEDSAV